MDSQNTTGSLDQLSPAEIKTAPKLYEWIFERINSYIEGHGAELFLNEEPPAHFCKNSGIESDELFFNTTKAKTDETYLKQTGTYDWIIALHTSQQTARSCPSVTYCGNLLKKNGVLIIQLPLYIALYNGLDEGFNTWTHYNITTINKTLQAKFNILKIRYYIVTQSPALITVNKSNYKDGLNLFNKTSDYDQEGLFAIVIGQKK